MLTLARFSAFLGVVVVAGCKGPEARPANRDPTHGAPAVTVAVVSGCGREAVARASRLERR
jgi:hypothetical protein